jgi:elongation factor 1-alpha
MIKIKSSERHCDIMSEVLPGDILGLHVSSMSVKDVQWCSIAADSKNDPSVGAAGFSA